MLPKSKTEAVSMAKYMFEHVVGSRNHACVRIVGFKPNKRIARVIVSESNVNGAANCFIDENYRVEWTSCWKPRVALQDGDLINKGEALGFISDRDIAFTEKAIRGTVRLFLETASLTAD
jgi:hypothetical protein